MTFWMEQTDTHTCTQLKCPRAHFSLFTGSKLSCTNSHNHMQIYRNIHTRHVEISQNGIYYAMKTMRMIMDFCICTFASGFCFPVLLQAVNCFEGIIQDDRPIWAIRRWHFCLMQSALRMSIENQVMQSNHFSIGFDWSNFFLKCILFGKQNYRSELFSAFGVSAARMMWKMVEVNDAFTP